MVVVNMGLRSSVRDSVRRCVDVRVSARWNRCEGDRAVALCGGGAVVVVAEGEWEKQADESGKTWLRNTLGVRVGESEARVCIARMGRCLKV